MIQLPPILQYLLESSLCLLVFFLLYKALFQKNTFFQANRFYLLSGALFSFIIPALHFTWQQQEIEVLAPMVYGSEFIIYGFNESLEQAAPLFSLTLGQLLLIIYTIGVLFFSTRLLKRVYTLYQITQHNPKEKKQGVLTLHTETQDTSSFFKWLFFNPRHANEDSHLILEHELVHIRQWHSADVMIMEILTIINWFNPIIHLYNRSLRETHEFIADKFVASLANSKYDYAKLLVDEVGKSINPALSNTFASLIKKRLVMLSTQNSKKRKGVYYLSIIPVLMLLMTLFSFNLADPISGLEELSGAVEEFIEEPILPSEKDANEEILLDEKETSDVLMDNDLLLENGNNPLESISKLQVEIGEPQIIRKGGKYILYINGIESQQNNICVFDRWGNQMFKTDNYQNDKDVTNWEFATYFYVLELGDEKKQGYLYKKKGSKKASLKMGNLFIEEEMKEEETGLPFFKIEMTLEEFNRLSLKDRMPLEIEINTNEGSTIIDDFSLTIVPEKKDPVRIFVSKNRDKETLGRGLSIINDGTGLYFENKVLDSNMATFLYVKIKEKNSVVEKIFRDSVTPPGGKIFKEVEYMPHFAGCEDIVDEKERKKCSDLKIINFLSSNIKYPEAARKNGTQGTAVIRFTIEQDGSLFFDEKNMEKCMLKDPGDGCGAEALRVMKSMPDWIPGKEGGKNVRVQFTMPIKFKLAEEPPAPPVPPTPPAPPAPPKAAPPAPPTPPVAPPAPEPYFKTDNGC